MSSNEKLSEKILADPPKSDITYKQAESFLISKGFVRKPDHGGSHVVFKHDKCKRLVTLVTNTKTLRRDYIKNIQEAIEEIEGK